MQDLLTLLCGLQEQPRPALHDEPARTATECREQLLEDEGNALAALAMPVRNALRPAGEGWSPERLRDWATEWAAESADMQSPQRAARTQFALDAEWVLKDRVRQVTQLGDAAFEIPEELVDADDAELDISALLAATMPAPATLAPESASVSNHDLLNALRAQLPPQGEFAYHLTEMITMLLVLGTLQGDDALARQAGQVLLRPGGHRLMQMARLGQVAAVARFYASGALALDAGVSAEDCKRWLAALATRRTAAPADESAQPARGGRALIQTTQDLASLCHGTSLQDCEWTVLPVPGCDDVAFGACCPVAQSEALWQAARALLPQTGRWPLLVTSWGGDDDLVAQDFFLRSEYEQSSLALDDVSPSALIARANQADPQAFLRALIQQREEGWTWTWPEWWEVAEPATRHLLGDAPTEDEMMRQAQQRHGSPLQELAYIDWERLLWDWERQHTPNLPAHKLQEVRPEPFVPDNTALLLLPTDEPWSALAYINFFGLDDTAGGIALGREWRQRWGAELYAHWGTMLQCHVSRAPERPEQALQLAHEHDIFASCTLAPSGISLRYYAQGLLGRDFWFLHQRP